MFETIRLARSLKNSGFIVDKSRLIAYFGDFFGHSLIYHTTPSVWEVIGEYDGENHVLARFSKDKLLSPPELTLFHSPRSSEIETAAKRYASRIEGSGVKPLKSYVKYPIFGEIESVDVKKDIQ